MALILDTGPLLATLDRDDADHAACRRLIEGTDEHLVVPAPVLVELDYWIHTRLRQGVFLAFMDYVFAGAFRIEDLQAQDYLRVREICDRYADFDVGFVDAAVLAVVERFNEPELAMLDQRHFRVLRPRHVDALQLVPEDR